MITKDLQKQIVDHRRLNELFNVAVNELPPSMTACDKLHHIVDLYKMLLIECTRTITVRAKLKGFCPWMTADLWELIRIKDKLLKRSRRNPADDNLSQLLTHVSNLLRKKKAQFKRNYYENLLAGSNQKDAWRIVNNALGKEQDHRQITTIQSGEEKITDMAQICSSFNNFFCSIGSNLASAIISNRDIQQLDTANPQPTSMYIGPATINETIILINNLKRKKSPGPDSIPPSFVKDHHSIFAPLLTEVFNEIILTGQYPECLKTARVVPIFKSGDPKDLNNYRPISCLSVLDKIIEKLLVKRINDYVHHYKLLYDYQYGFREGSSTLSATCDLVEDIYVSLDNRNMAATLFIDLKKAFDTIDHRLLVQKLELLGIRGVANDLLSSYLNNRQQYVSIGEYRSELCHISTGVPQGSNLGPVLFLLFVNDISNLPLKGKLRLFADDTSVSYQGSSIDAVQEQIKHDLLLLQDYFKANLLSLNLRKTKYMLFHSVYRQIPSHAALEIHGEIIEEVAEYTFLGLTIDSTLSWSAHINQLKRKLCSFCGLLRKISAFLPCKWLTKLYIALVHSRLQYLIAIWGQANKTRLKELQVIQNRCLKVVFRKPYLFPTESLYTEPSNIILPIKAMHEMQVVTFMHQLLSSPTTHHNITIRRIHSERASRQAGNLALARCRTQMGKRRFTYAASKLYNALPTETKASRSLKNFKVLIKQLFKQQIRRFLT